MKEIVVIGAGPAGLTAAITAAKKGKKVTIIERNNKCGKKLLITGNGKCNYFNENQDIKNYNSNNKKLLKEIIKKENTDKVLSFFNKLEIIPKIKNGYYYPFTEQASTIHNALLYEIKKLNIEVIYETKVTDIKKENHFIITTDKGKIKAKKIILACGSKAAPKTGSDGTGYELAKKLNHSIITPYPALTSLKGKETYFKKWSGIRTDATITLYEDDKEIKKESGNLQLTDYGLSGIIIFNLSSHIAKNIKKHREEIHINFMPWLKESAYTFLKNKSYPIRQTLERFLHYKLVDIIIKKSDIKTDNFKKLSSEDYKKLVYNLTNFIVKIKEVNSFEKAQVCSGGIPLEEIDTTTFESKKTKDLFLAGEILDVDGACGGYNLTFAWISGINIGENI